MASRSYGIHGNQNAANYVNKKGINELFEAIMTALMVHKPDDHLAFIRECLDKVQNSPTRVRWDFFVTNTSTNKSAIPSRSTIGKNRPKALPPVRSSSTTSPSTTNTRQSSNRQPITKAAALPPIDNYKKTSQSPPTIFILSSTGSTLLCSRLLERYDQVTYLLINDVANIDDDEHLDLSKHEHRYDSLRSVIEQRQATTNGFLISGHFDEKQFWKKWQEKLGRIDLFILLSSDRSTIINGNVNIIYIDPKDDFEIILANTIFATDAIFPAQKTKVKQDFQLMEEKTIDFSLPIIFCIDNHQLPVKGNNHHGLVEHQSLDEEFDLTNGNEEESNNSFIYTLCERLAEQFSFKHIHYGDFNQVILDFEQLKSSIVDSMNSYAGYIIDHFPTSFTDLQKFQSEVGPCSALIYIGEHQTETKDDELNGIVEKFKHRNKAVYIDSRVEVDEIYEDLKKDILKLI